MIKDNTTNDDKTWIAIRINDAFININDEPYDVYVMMNAMTAFVFGHVLARADQSPTLSDVSQLFDKAHQSHGKWPDKLIIPESSYAGEVFQAAAENHKIIVETTPLSQLSPIIKPLMEAFAEEAEED